MIKVAFVGLGYWGPNLLRNLSALEDVEITALCDFDLKRVESLRQRYCPAARTITDYHALADDHEVDAVIIATPIRTHYELGSFLLSSGKHVFIEKPLARTVAECQALLDLAERYHRVLMVGHVFEFNVAVQRIKQYIDEGQLGKLFYVYSQRVNLGRIQHDVNALWSFAPHDISIMNYWFGQEPLRVSARGFSYLNSGIEDVVFVTLEYPNGVGAHLHLGWLDPRKMRLMTLVGSKKMLVYDDVSLDAKIQIYDKGISNLDDFLKTPETFAEFQFQLRMGDLVIPTIHFGEPLQSECQHFIDCVQNNRQPRTDALNGLRVVRVLEAAERSISQDGKPVELAQTELSHQ
jgi:predicted dehydrogenase